MIHISKITEHLNIGLLTNNIERKLNVPDKYLISKYAMTDVYLSTNKR